MMVQPYSTSLVSRLSLPTMQQMPQGYFRSRLFVIAATANPLVAAAGPLFSLLERLSTSMTLPPVQAIRDNIEHELLAFRSRLSGQDYAEEFTLIAHYLLSATIDELLGKNYLRVHGQPAEFQAFTPVSSGDQDAPQHRFFKVIDSIKERANQYLDLIELAYYCLITGFEGEHHFLADGRQRLDNLIEELHQLIQQYRVNKPYHLLKERSTQQPQLVDHKPMVVMGLLALSLLGSVYFGLHALLEHKAQILIAKNAHIFSVMDV